MCESARDIDLRKLRRALRVRRAELFCAKCARFFCVVGLRFALRSAASARAGVCRAFVFSRLLHFYVCGNKPANSSGCGYGFAGCRSVGAFRARRAFTLAEILLSIALIAAMTTLIAGAVAISQDKLAQRPPEAVLSTAVRRAADFARERGRSMVLNFDARGFFQISDAETLKPACRIFLDAKKNREQLERMKRAQESESADMADSAFAAAFLSSFSEDSDDYLFGGAQSGNFSAFGDDSRPKFVFYQIYPKLINPVSIKFPEEPIKFLRFSPDGTMTRARIVLKRGSEESEFESDIFCAPPKEAPEDGGEERE